MESVYILSQITWESCARKFEHSKNVQTISKSAKIQGKYGHLFGNVPVKKKKTILLPILF